MSGAFQDQVAWITGAGTGLGRHLALELARGGAHLALSGRRADKLEAVAAEVQALGRQALVLPLDVLDQPAQLAAAARIGAELGGIDIAVANAGYSAAGDLAEIPLDQLERQIRTNVVGMVGTIQAAMPWLRQRKGRMVLIGSVAHAFPAPGFGAYNASKAAVHSLGETLSAEVAGSGVSCTTIHPGFVESDISKVDNDNISRADRGEHRPAALLWPTDKAARVMARAIARRRRIFVFTGHGRLTVLLYRFAPWLIFQMAKATRGSVKRSG